ncbi:unnamed protein product [Alopecurus aequalis]
MRRHAVPLPSGRVARVYKSRRRSEALEPSQPPVVPHRQHASYPMPELEEFRDWANLPDLPLEEVLWGLVPCVRSVSAFAATCRPWRRLLRASAAGVVRPRVPPLILLLRPAPRLTPFSPLVAPQPIPYRLAVPAEGSTLLSASRGHLALLRRNSLHLIDALTGAERRAFQLPSPHFPYHYAALSPTRLLLFHSKHAFFSLPFPGPDHHPHPEWTKHDLPRVASYVTTVLEFHGRILGLTDRAQMLEFLHLDGDQAAVHMLPTAGLPPATTFDRSHLGPHLVAAGERLLLVLFMKLAPRVHRVAVHVLDSARMTWEEVDDIGAYTVFVDCAGRSAVACVDVGCCGVEENRVYVLLPNCRTWKAVKPGRAAPLNQPMPHPPWPSAVSVYPPLFF